MCNQYSSSVNPRVRIIIVEVMRRLLGLLFIFSGFVKAVDPVGSASYVEGYFDAYGLSAAGWVMLAIAMVLSTFEFLLGVLLVMGVWRDSVMRLLLFTLLFFTLLTLLSATLFPVAECGCFGAALMLSPWMTFWKNVVMLCAAYVVWRRGDAVPTSARRAVVAIVVGLVIPILINIYSYRHLPLVDFMPYKIGLNLREAVAARADADTMLRFRDVEGNVVEFSADDTSCWMREELTYVDSYVRMYENEYAEFVMYNHLGEDVTLDVVNRDNRTALLFISRCDVDAAVQRGIDILFESYPPWGVVVVASCDISNISLPEGVEVVTMDAMTMGMIIRSAVGVVVLNNGIIEYKSNITSLLPRYSCMKI